MTELVRCLVICPEALDNQAWWRVTYPLSVSPRFLLNIPSQVGWMEIARANVAVLQRPFTDQHLGILRMVRQLGVPVVLDFDDLLWQLPEGHPSENHYGPNASRVASECIREAELTITSTPTLAREIHARGARRVEVVPNAFPEYLRWNVPQSARTVWWRGGSMHQTDIDGMEEEIIAVMQKHPDWGFFAAGCTLTKMRRALGARFKHQGVRALQDYHNQMQAVSPAVMVGPLEDIPFNRCKSNIGWMEASLAGAVYVAPDFDEYAVPGCVRYKPGEFAATLDAAMSMTNAERLANVAHAREYIDANLRISKVNPKRDEMIVGVAKGGVIP